MDCLIVGCGLTGSVIARELAEKGRRVRIWERRGHIGGNMYDYVDERGFLVQKYGPHTFHTDDPELYRYICRFEDWKDFHLTCGAVWDGKYTPTPFNFTTIDTFFPSVRAEKLKAKLKTLFGGRDTATVLEVLQHPDPDVRAYGEYLFENDYAPYTAKQWGMEPESVDPSVLKRVPLRFSYQEGYFDDEFQVMPERSFTAFFENMLDNPNITVHLGVEALDRLKVKDRSIYVDGVLAGFPIVYTGALDELFGYVHGELPYRSLRFEWRYDTRDGFQSAPVVAYPQEQSYTRITEYKKLPVQNKPGTSYALEYPVHYQPGKKMEPYYPVPTRESATKYLRYRGAADKIPNLICCGRLGDYQYYNMDQALKRALAIAERL